jgi:hypothetical protein
MADKKISALTASATPLAGTEVLPIVQSGSTVKVAVSNLTAGRSVGMQQANIAAAAGGGFANPAFIADDGTGAARIIFLGAPYAGVPVNKPWIHSYQDIYVGSDAGTTFNVISSGVKTLGVDGSGNATVSGNVVIGTAAKGIDFSANTHAAGMTSELLTWYEEGNWTPTFTFGTPGDLNIVYSSQVGKYTRIGRTVHVEMTLATSTFTHTTAAGNATINGLPFTIGGTDTTTLTGACGGYVNVTYPILGMQLFPTVSSIFLVKGGPGAGAPTTFVDFPSGGTLYITFQATYII